MLKCAHCTLHGCESGDAENTMSCCPGRDGALQQEAARLYQEDENLAIARSAALVESEGYGRLCRMEEIMLFCGKLNYRRLGLIFCAGLKREAKTVCRILEHNGFEVVSAICKNGGVPKASMGLDDSQTVSGCAQEPMCNPIAQALLMNQEKTDFNLILGLCVGHDSLAIKYLDAPVTILAAKDRVTGHNPLAAIYMADGYYKKRFFK